MFVLIGAEQHTDWLREVVALDERGFILTGRDVPESAWLESRSTFGTGRSNVSLERLGKARSPWAPSTGTFSFWQLDSW